MAGPGKAAWVFSLLLHGGLIGLLLFGPSLRPTQAPELPVGVIDAVILDAKDIQRLVDMEIPEPDPKLQAERKEQERQRQLERDRLEQQRIQRKKDEDARKKRLEDERAAAKADADRIAAEKEAARVTAALEKKKKDDAIAAQKAKDKLAREKAAALAKQKAEEARIAAEEAEKERIAKEKAAAAQKKKEEEARIAKAAEAKRQAALERQKELERQLRQARIDELQENLGVAERRANAVDSGQLDQYKLLIIAKVERFWNPPAETPEGLSCKVKAQQIPGGDVMSVEVLSCNGNDAVEREIIKAVKLASPLPGPPDPTLFERTIIFTFEPKD